MNWILIIGWSATMAAALRFAFKCVSTARSEALMAAELEATREKLAIIANDNRQKDKQNAALANMAVVGTVTHDGARSVRNWAEALNAGLDKQAVLAPATEVGDGSANRLITDQESEPRVADTHPGSVGRLDTVLGRPSGVGRDDKGDL